MPKPGLSESEVRKVVETLAPEYTNYPVIVLGVRGYFLNSLGEKGKNDRGIYDDAAFIVTKDKVTNWNFNTDPSAYKKGIATLRPGLWWFIPGKHKIESPSGYAAFRQYKNVAITRDGGKSEAGYFGINLHRGGTSNTSSLGCQTVPENQWIEFRDTIMDELGVTPAQCVAERTKSGIKDKQFPYLLIERDELETIIGRSL